MSSLLGISEAASIGWHAMIVLADSAGGVVSTAAIARKLNVSTAHLSKVLQRLTKAGLVSPQRGPRGGFRLGRDPRTISLLEIYETIEGPLSDRRCLLRQPICSGRCCMIGDLFEAVNSIKTELSETSLAEATEKTMARGDAGSETPVDSTV